MAQLWYFHIDERSHCVYLDITFCTKLLSDRGNDIFIDKS